MAYREKQYDTVATKIILLLCFSSCCGRPQGDLPQNWRDLLTDAVYSYHLNKQSQSVHSTIIEGDIKHQIPAFHLMRTEAKGTLLRNAIADRSLRWEGGIVPYEISDSFTDNEKDVIEEALRDLMLKTCVRFIPHTDQPDYIKYVRRSLGCSSYVARIGGEQLIDLMTGCIYQIGEVQHETLHALGFYHEQSRMDRDDHVKIIWSNVIAGAEGQFEKYRSDNLHMPYDYNSVMHYGWNYFAIDQSKPTILPKIKADLGTRVVVSQWDVEKVNRLYDCPQRQETLSPTVPITTTTTTTTTKTISTPYSVADGEARTDTPWRTFKHEVKDWLRHHLPHIPGT